MTGVEIIGGLLATLAALVGFYIKRLYTMLDKVIEDVHEHRVDSARNCMTRAEMTMFAQAIKEDISKLMNPLHDKLRDIESHLRHHNDKGH